MMDKAGAFYGAEDTFSRVLVLRSTVSSLQNDPAKSSDAGLIEGCFFKCSCLGAAQKIALGLMATHEQNK